MLKVRSKKLIRAAALALAVTFTAAVPAVLTPETARAETATIKITPEYKQTVARSQLAMINSWRAGSTWYYNSSGVKQYLNGLKALKYDYTLEQYAMQRAAEIALSFDHTRPIGDKRHGLSGYLGIGENIAATTNSKGATADYALTMFKEEDKPYSGQGHRRMMLSVPADFDAVGIACVYYKGCYYWAQEFGVTSKPNTTATTAVNGNRTMTVELDTDLLTSKSADMSAINNWQAKLRKGETDYLPEITLNLGMTDTWPYAAIPVTAVPTWSSSNTGVATVNSNAGTITGVNSGSTNVTANESITGMKKTTSVTVTDPNAVTGVSLNRTTLSLNTGATSALTATVSPSSATNKNVTWSSSNTAVATVSSSGVVKGVKAGTATITCRTVSGGKTATCKVTVSDIVPTGISLNRTSGTFRVGQTLNLTATVTPSNATNKNITWSSNNTSVATVSAAGVVKGVKAGTAVITGKTVSGAKTATCSVTVLPMLSGMVQDSDGVWRYYSNNSVNTSFTGMVKKGTEWWFIKSGVYQSDYHGLVYYNNQWWYVSQGKQNTSYTGLTYYNNQWWYVSNGTLNKSYEGLTQYNGGWWFIKNGTIAKYFTGILLYNGNNWYVKAGKVDKSFTGLTYYNNDWWYVTNGFVGKTWKGLVYCNNKWWYVNGPHIDRTYNSLCYANGAWWYIKNGTIDKSYTGLTPYNGNLWYVKNGTIDKNFKGNVTYQGQTYRVNGGVGVLV